MSEILCTEVPMYDPVTFPKPARVQNPTLRHLINSAIAKGHALVAQAWLSRDDLSHEEFDRQFGRLVVCRSVADILHDLAMRGAPEDLEIALAMTDVHAKGLEVEWSAKKLSQEDT